MCFHSISLASSLTPCNYRRRDVRCEIALRRQTGSPWTLVPGSTVPFVFFFLFMLFLTLFLNAKYSREERNTKRISRVSLRLGFNTRRKFGILLYTKLTDWVIHVILSQHTRGSSSLLTQLKRLSVDN